MTEMRRSCSGRPSVSRGRPFACRSIMRPESMYSPGIERNARLAGYEGRAGWKFHESVGAEKRCEIARSLRRTRLGSRGAVHRNGEKERERRFHLEIFIHHSTRRGLGAAGAKRGIQAQVNVPG